MNQEIRRKLDHITQILWAGGVTNPVTYIEQISYFIFLKLLDEEEVERELRGRLLGRSEPGKKGHLLFPKQAERYRWSKWKYKSGIELRDFVRDEVFPYMASLVKDEPRAAEFFRDAVLEISDTAVLKQVVDELDQIEFRKLGPDVKGDIFEYLLTHLGQSKLNGQFRTPRQIRAFMIEMVAPDLGDTIFDPSCGTGGFLIDAVDYLLAKYSEHPQEVPIYGEEWLERRGQTLAEAKKENPNLQTYRKGTGEKIPDWGLLESSIHGVDVSRQLTRIAMMNLVLHNVRHANLKRANSLSELGGLSEEDLNRRYKIILSNPPFAGQLPLESIRQDLPTQSKKSELLFLGLMLKHLAPGGRCAVVVPEGVLFNSSNAHVELRRKLVEEFELLAVVSLPTGVFKPYASAKTGVIIFRRPLKGRKQELDKVWFFDLKNDGYDPDKVQGGGRPETPAQNDIPRLLAEWKRYKASGFTQPPGIEANKMLAPGVSAPQGWWASLETVAESDYSLDAAHYKPRISSRAVDVNAAHLIRQVLKHEHKIQEGLEQLLARVQEET